MRKNNKGLSLVELLVAITILAIIVAPLLRLFVLSARINLKSKTNLNAVTIAENVMEGVKANSIEDLVYKFNYPAGHFDIINNDNLEASSEIVQLRNSGSSYSVIMPGDADANITSSDGGMTYEFDKGSGKYYFCVKDIKPSMGSYDALIAIDATPYREGSKPSTPEHEYNAKGVPDIQSLAGEGNATFLQNKLKDTNVLTDLQMKGIDEISPAYPAITEDNLYRNIKLNLVEESGKSVAKLTYEYTAKNVPGVADVTVSEENILSYSGAEINNIYIFYCPLYTSRAGDIHDKISIENLSDIKANVYLIKQEMSSPTGLRVDEQLYRVDVALRESSSRPYAVKIRTNIDYNLAKAYFDDVDEEVNQGYFTYNSAGGSTIKDKLVTDLADTKDKDRYFDVKVSVYKNEDVSGYDYAGAEEIYVIEGSTEE